MSTSDVESSDGGVPVDNKRKRKSIVPSDEELEIDVNLPEPPSKKAKRLEKKKAKAQKNGVAKSSQTSENVDPTIDSISVKGETAEAVPISNNAGGAKRSEYGIWIGNLPWSATKDTLREFFVHKGLIDDCDITRLNLPAPTDKGPSQQRIKPQNKGFAYLDFTSQAALDKALGLSETLLAGRKVLIKNAKSFEGRPVKSAATTGNSNGEINGEGGASENRIGGKPVSKRIFVGNLDFSVTRDELYEHFGQAGEVEDVHLATFEDSGKCKGFAWIRFVEVEAAEAAVRGFIFKTKASIEAEDEDGFDDNDDDDGERSSDEDERGHITGKPKKKKKKNEKKKQKWFINRLHGRTLRCEFAEDAQTRYKKRFGKEGKDHSTTRPKDAADGEGAEETAPSRPARRERPPHKKRDARTVAPGQALANAPRSSGAIVAAAGTKVTFD